MAQGTSAERGAVRSPLMSGARAVEQKGLEPSLPPVTDSTWPSLACGPDTAAASKGGGEEGKLGDLQREKRSNLIVDGGSGSHHRHVPLPW